MRRRCAARHRIAPGVVRGRFLIERLTGKTELRLHHPEPREVVLVHDAPWEGNGSGFHSVFQDGGRYRMFYKAWNITLDAATHRIQASAPFCCSAESADGIHWRKPELGLHEFQGAKANNIVMPDYKTRTLHVNSGAAAVGRDENPAAAPDARYKAMFQCLRPRGMIPFKSPDGLHWTPMSDRPVIVDGAFDSQNTAFWDGVRGEYRAYWRHYSQGDNDTSTRNPIGDRAIRTATSQDFLHWNMQADLRYVDSPSEALYTNAIKPYHRAPHLIIGFPTRYVDRGWSDSNAALPEREHREQRRAINPRYGAAMTEGLIMTSRDGVTFKRWNEAFLRPRHRARGHLELRAAVHRLAPRGDQVRARGRAQRALPLCERELLDGQQQRAAPLHAAAGRLRLRARSHERRRTPHQAAAFQRQETRHQFRHLRRRQCARGNSGREWQGVARLRSRGVPASFRRHDRADRDVEEWRRCECHRWPARAPAL
ncbi:MAG: hypothetical protein M3463_06895 [Verrucomicrobiota bacterium]|nr:hypothetical protein [Verrucomicrobiota bacterium]